MVSRLSDATPLHISETLCMYNYTPYSCFQLNTFTCSVWWVEYFTTLSLSLSSILKDASNNHAADIALQQEIWHPGTHGSSFHPDPLQLLCKYRLSKIPSGHASSCMWCILLALEFGHFDLHLLERERESSARPQFALWVWSAAWTQPRAVEIWPSPSGLFVHVSFFFLLCFLTHSDHHHRLRSVQVFGYMPTLLMFALTNSSNIHRVWLAFSLLPNFDKIIPVCQILAKISGAN